MTNERKKKLTISEQSCDFHWFNRLICYISLYWIFALMQLFLERTNSCIYSSRKVNLSHLLWVLFFLWPYLIFCHIFLVIFHFLNDRIVHWIENSLNDKVQEVRHKRNNCYNQCDEPENWCSFNGLRKGLKCRVQVGKRECGISE